MSDEEKNVSVSALRAQIQEKLALNGHKPNGTASTPPPSRDENDSPPPVPPHSPKPPSSENKPARPPPPPPDKWPSPLPSNNKVEALRRSSAVKPPIAPKPLDIRKTSAPTIIVDSIQTDDDAFFQRNGSVRARALELEKSGFALRSCAGSVDELNPPNDRPLSITSTSSAHSEMSDSDSDSDDRPPELLKTIGLEIMAPGKTSIRRPSALCFNGDVHMHEMIMKELKNQGVVSSTHHQGLYKKKKTEVQSPRTRRAPYNNNNNINKSPIMRKEEIPPEVGKMRDEKKPRQPEMTLSMASTSTTQSEDSARGYDRSSMMTICTENSGEDVEIEVRDYNTGDPVEDKRLKKLHYAANEFFTVQRNFVRYLEEMEAVYPKYVEEFGRQLGKDLLSSPPGQIHPVRQLQKEFNQLINVHKTILGEFAAQYAKWDSQNPTMSSVFRTYADYLKICIPFLKVKSKLVDDLIRLREENKDFDNATVAFEQKIFNRGVGAVVQQLDQVHQNFMRYKILMISYQNYLKEDSDEFKEAVAVIQKLEEIAQKVNGEMGLPTNEELSKLYDKFQTHFDVFAPGRRLIRQGEAMKQTRKEPQPRYLVLFSDFFWICRVASLSSGLFDLNRSYHIPTEYITTESFEHEDFEAQLRVKSKEKSFALIFKNVAERKQWEADINQARDEKRKYKRRMSEIAQKEKKHHSLPVLIQPTLVEEGPESPSRSAASSDLQFISLSHTESIDSQPSTPGEDPGPFPSSSVTAPPKGKVRRADREKAIWLPDDGTSKCLMEGCGTVFTLFTRRHHCRSCGYIMCSKCSGRAPVPKCDFKKELVCPECYGQILDQYLNGNLFPERVLVKGSDGNWRVRLQKGKTSKNYELVEPRTLFSPPQNIGLKKAPIEVRLVSTEELVFNEVYVRTRDGSEIQRFAQLDEGTILKFFKMRFDDEPIEQHVIYGFELNETVLDEGGMLFELIHRNQIQTDRREHVIAFRVQNKKSVQKWSTALQQAVGVTASKEDDS